MLDDMPDNGVLARVDVAGIEQLTDVRLKQQHAHHFVDTPVQALDDNAQTFQMKGDEGVIGVRVATRSGLAALVEQGEIAVNLLLVEPGKGKWCVFVPA